MILVKDIMNKRPVCVRSTDQVTHARSLVRDCGCRALAVLDKGRQDKLIGVVSRGDILKITSNKTNMEVKGIMSSNLVLAADEEDIRVTAKKMIKSGIRQLPVINDNKLVGMVSSRDIVSALIGDTSAKSGSNDTSAPRAPRKDPLHVRDIMVEDAVYCEPDDDLSKVWDKMQESGFTGLPVTNKGKVIGIITRMDIFKHGSLRLSKESGKGKSIPVKKAMQTPAITTQPDTTVEDAAAMIVKSKIVRLPVVDSNGKLEGIVDIGDIMSTYVS